MNRRLLLAAAIIVVLWLPATGSGAVYKYVDDSGVTNFTDSMDKVPKQYRGKVQEVKTEIQVQGQQKPAVSPAMKLLGKGNASWQDFVVKDQSGNAAGVDVRKLMLQSMFESKLIFWLAGELLFSVVMLILLIAFIGWPTARGRMTALLMIAVVWVVGSAVVMFGFTRPAAQEFFAITRGYLSEVIKEAPLDESGKAKLKDLNNKLGELQEKTI
jgi:hypothetical protein